MDEVLHYVLGQKTLLSQSLSLDPGLLMATGNFNAEDNFVKDKHTIQRGVEIHLLVES